MIRFNIIIEMKHIYLYHFNVTISFKYRYSFIVRFNEKLHYVAYIHTLSTNIICSPIKSRTISPDINDHIFSHYFTCLLRPSKIRLIGLPYNSLIRLLFPRNLLIKRFSFEIDSCFFQLIKKRSI